MGLGAGSILPSCFGSIPVLGVFDEEGFEEEGQPGLADAAPGGVDRAHGPEHAGAWIWWRAVDGRGKVRVSSARRAPWSLILMQRHVARPHLKPCDVRSGGGVERGE